MLSHPTIVENPCASFPRASTWICEIASSFNVDEWENLVISASISYGFQSRPTNNGHPTHAYCNNKFAARFCLDLHIGNAISPNFPSTTPSVPVNSLSNRRRSSANSVADLFFTNVAEHCPVLVLAVQLPSMRSTHAFSRVGAGSRVHVRLVS